MAERQSLGRVVVLLMFITHQAESLRKRLGSRDGEYVYLLNTDKTVGLFPQEFERQVRELERQLEALKKQVGDTEVENGRLEGQRGVWARDRGALVDQSSQCETLEQDLGHVMQIITDGVESGSLKVSLHHH